MSIDRLGSVARRGAAAVSLASVLLLAFGCGPDRALPDGIDLSRYFRFAEARGEVGQIDLGSPGAWWHLVQGWSSNERSSGRTFVWALGPRSTLRFSLGVPRDLTLVLTGWSMQPSQEVQVSANGKPVGRIAVTPEPGDFDIVVPAEVLVAGENRLQLASARVVQPVTIDAQSKDDRPLAVALDRVIFKEIRSTRVPRVERKWGDPVVVLPLPSSVDYYLEVQPGWRFVCAEAILRRSRSGEARLIVKIETVSAGVREYQVTVTPDGTEVIDLPLEAREAEPARVSLEVRSDRSDDAGEIEILVPRIVTGTGEDLRAEHDREAAVTRPTQRARRPNIIIYLVDALRADHLGCYGYDRPTSPRLDAFAEQAVLFERALAQSPWTRPSVVSLLTGLFPQVHGVNRNNSVLSGELTTLAEMLQSAGYETAAVVTNMIVSEKFGFAQGFDWFRHLRSEDRPQRYRRELLQKSDRVNEVAFEWLAQRDPARPFFLYLHTTDPHMPYTPRERYRKQFAADVTDDDLGSWVSVKGLERSLDPAPEAVIRDLLALYDGEVAFNDRSFGLFIKELQRRGLYRDSIIVFVSDHGEEFFDHGRWEHSFSLYQELLHVPLVIKLPDQERAGLRVRGAVRQVDVLPTILDYLGQAVPPQIQGASLLPRLTEAQSDLSGPPSFALLECGHRYAETITHGKRKLIRNLAFDRPRPQIELFDLQADPSEQRNLASSEAIWAGYYLALLEMTKAGWQEEERISIELDADTQEQLKALGYLQ